MISLQCEPKRCCLGWLYAFHAASRVHPVVPILVVTQGPPRPTAWPLLWHGVTPVLDATARSLPALVHEVVARIPATQRPLNASGWEVAPYRPVPTIVEAATMLYRRHGVAEIAAARADVGNLTRTSDAIAAAIAQARADKKHLVLFVTGIPGAGKTLCGLHIVFGADSGAAFLTGNLPLVFVMREALARDARDQGRSMRMARQQTESAIQPLIGFLRDNRERTDPPHEHVVVFDEAQRAWDATFGARKFGHAQSEAAMFLDIMRRHPDWAVIVALVGTGQEINTGEAGLAAWGEALLQRPDWCVHAPDGVLAATDPTPAAVHHGARGDDDRSAAASGRAGPIGPLGRGRAVGRCRAARCLDRSRNDRRGGRWCAVPADPLAARDARGATPARARAAPRRAGVQRRRQTAAR
jgi:hypothetical protein